MSLNPLPGTVNDYVIGQKITVPFVDWLNRLFLTITTFRPWVVIAPAFAASMTIDLSTLSSFGAIEIEITLTANLNFDIINGQDGQVIRVDLLQGGAGGFTFTGGAHIRFATGLPSPTLTVTAGKMDRLGFVWSSSVGKADFVAIVQGF